MSLSVHSPGNDHYRSLLIDAVDYLCEMREQLFSSALNVAMKRELHEIDQAFDLGDRYTFELRHLEDLSDPNVQTLVQLIQSVERSVESIININNISDSELEQNNNT